MSHVSSHEIEPRQQVLRVSWDTASSTTIVNSSSASSAAAAVNNVDIRCYDVPRLRHNTTRPPYLPAGAGCLLRSPKVRDVVCPDTDAAVRWKPGRVPYQLPPPSPITPRHPTLNGLSEMCAVGGYRASTAGHGGGRATLYHVDRGACTACEYIRHNIRLRYEPYNTTRRYAKPTSTELRRVSYY